VSCDFVTVNIDDGNARRSESLSNDDGYLDSIERRLIGEERGGGRHGGGEKRDCGEGDDSAAAAAAVFKRMAGGEKCAFGRKSSTVCV